MSRKDRSGDGPVLAYYIDGHGFGHATRSLAVLAELWRARPDQPVLVRTSAPAFLFDGVRGPVRLVEGEVDPGTVQADPLSLDVEASLKRRARFQETMGERVLREVDRLASVNVGLVAGDIPPLAFEVAAALGVRSVALGNFSWDWIYEPYLEGRTDRWPLEAMRRSYARADLLLRMPFHGDMSAFPRIEDIPHVVRRPSKDPGQVRSELGLAGERRPVVLVSFGGFATLRLGGGAGADVGDFRLVVIRNCPPGLPADTVRLPVDHGFAHEDLVAAVDAVISKPGYSTVAECIAARTPLLYTSRDEFREYPVLVEGLRRTAHARFLPREDLLALRWRRHLEGLLAERIAWAAVRTDGASVAAGRLLDLLGA